MQSYHIYLSIDDGDKTYYDYFASFKHNDDAVVKVRETAKSLIGESHIKSVGYTIDNLESKVMFVGEITQSGFSKGGGS